MSSKKQGSKRTGKTAMNRRMFLGVTGGVAAAAALGPSLARAQGGTAPKRLVVIFTPDGTLHNEWRPTGSKTDFTLPSILAPFESLRDDMIVLDGIDNRIYGKGDGDAHQQGMTQMLTGRPNTTKSATSTGMSVDEYIHQHISDGRPALRVAVGTNPNYISNWTRMTFDQNGSAIHPRTSPYQARDAMFPSTFDPTGGGGGSSAGADRARAVREGVLGTATARLHAMASQLRGVDRQRIESHAGSLENLAKLETMGTVAPSTDLVPLYDRIKNWTPNLVASPSKQADFPKIARMQMELISAAFAFDRSRVAVLQFSESNSGIKHTWAGAPSDKTHHGLSHDGNNTQLLKIYRWYSQQIAWFINDLKTNGLLDNTVVLWMTDMQTGENHKETTVPMTIFGGANHLQTGRYMNYRSSGGVAHNSVLTSLCNAMGLSDTKFGARDDGPLSGVT
ncbi:MAG: DUF1552 domain-containing protein [Polyangiales bacterium]